LRSKIVYQRVILIGLISFLVCLLNAQDRDKSEEEFYQVREYFDRSYGSDYNLLNGRKYYLLYSSVSHPFFGTDQYRTGNLLINGDNYYGALINYDIYKQQVILQYTSYLGRAGQLILTGESIEEFTLDGKLFRRMEFPETGTRFFQIVHSGEVSCFISWEKDLVYSPSSNTTLYNFTSQSRQTYLLISGRLYPFRYKSSFTKIFDKQFNKEIRRYLRGHQIYLREASDEQLRELVNFCINLKGDN